MKTNDFKSKLWFDRLLSKSLIRQFAVLVCALFLLFLMSWFFLYLSGCNWNDFAKDSNAPDYLLPLYLLIDTNAFNNLYINGVNGWSLLVGSITFIIGLFIFNGIIIGIITNSIERRVENHQNGKIHYLKSGHYVIMGYDDLVPSIVSYIFEKDKDAFVLVLTSEDIITIREKMLRSFSEKQMERIILNYGYRVSNDGYQDIHLETSKEVYIIGNHTNSTHDAINVECVDSIWRYLSNPEITQRPNRITCLFKDLDTYAAFKTSEIFRKVGELGIEFIPYNVYTGWAKQVFVKREYKDLENPGDIYKYPSVCGNGITPNDKQYVHLVFVGTTNFAVAFAMEAAHVLHFPNADKAKTRITFIDLNADKEKDEFITRNRHFFEVQSYIYKDLSKDKEKEQQGRRDEYVKFEGDFLDVEFEFIKGDVFSKAVQDEICNWTKEHHEKQYLSIFLAQADQRQNFVMAMNMPDEVYDKKVNIFILQDRSDNFVTNLRNADLNSKLGYYTVEKNGELHQDTYNARYANIYPFGMNETAYCADDHSLKRAKLINYLYSTANYNTHKFQGTLALDAMSEERIWAEANKYWQELTVALKWSNLYSAYAMRVKQETLRAMRGFAIDDTSHDYDPLSDEEVKALAQLEHNRWNVEKLLMGFRKAKPSEDKYVHAEYAEQLVTNKKRFIHHDIRPFDKLDTIAELDKEFSRYIPWIMKMTEAHN